MDLTAVAEARLREARFAQLPLAPEHLPPHYQGWGLLNLPPTVFRWLGVENPLPHRPLAPEILQALPERFRKVVLVLIDGFGMEMVRRARQQGLLSGWQRLAFCGVFTPLTSITPSTTSAALTTLWTGRSPTEHGIVGYEVWLKEYGVVANMIYHAPISFTRDVGSLEKAGFRPERFLPHPTLGQLFRPRGVKVYALQPYQILGSGLSRMLLPEVETVGFTTPADLWITLRLLLEERPEERAYIWVYWSPVDTLAHHHSPDDPRVLAEAQTFLAAMQAYLLRTLSPQAREGTLLLLTADHGQIVTPRHPHYELSHHPRLVERLHLLPTGENRLMFLYPRPGHTRAVREYFVETWPDDFALCRTEEVLRSGLLGPGEPHPALRDRTGDWVALARNHAYLWWAAKENHLLGRHGGLSPEEMLIPLLAVPLAAC